MIFITGGAGFIGSNFLRSWLAESDEPVLNLDKLTYAGHAATLAAFAHDPRHVFVRGDVADGALVGDLLQRHRPRAVLHFAAETHVDGSIARPGEFVQTNVVGTFALLEAVRGYWGSLAGAARAQFRLVHVSTDEVFGSLSAHEPPCAEGHACAPNSPYSASKAASEHLARAWHQTYGVPAITTRCGNNYGPWQFPEKLIPLMLVNALAGQPLPLYGDGLQVRDWLYVQDHCSALRRVLQAGTPGATYHIGANDEKNNATVVRTICALLDQWRPRADGHSYATQIAAVPDRPGHDRRYALDARKIRRELGWLPIETFASGIAKTVQWYLENPAWLAQVRP